MTPTKEEIQEWRRKNTIKIWNKTYIRTYWPNFYRLEEEDEDKAYYHIYINGEDVETLPLCASEDEAEMRFHELLDQHWIEDDDMYRWKERY